MVAAKTTKTARFSTRPIRQPFRGVLMEAAIMPQALEALLDGDVSNPRKAIKKGFRG